MSASSPLSTLRLVPTLLRGETQPIRVWIEHRSGGGLIFNILVIFVGAGLFGAAVGAWRDPVQALYTALKFPVILLLTALGNGLLNGLLAPLLGACLTLRQSLLAVLTSFTIASVILGAFSPVVYFLVWNTPSLAAPGGNVLPAHSVILLTQAALITFAGVMANVRLLGLLHELGSSASVARRVLMAWLTGNLLLGSQLAWILRPFVGSPGLPVQFLRPDPLNGSFFESLLRAAQQLLFP